MSKNKLGSTWAQWDLHFHTPASFDYANASIANAQIVDALLESRVRAVAITDHHVMDVGRIQDLRRLAKGRLTIFPGIELRSELGSKPIHYIGIFPETASLDHLWDTIKGRLGLTSQAIKEKGGDESVYVPIKDGHAVFSDLRGLISIHAGVKSNSIDSIENTQQYQQRLKYDITREYVDLLEIGQLRDVARYEGIIFPATKLAKPLIVGSDNHDATSYSTPLPCWIKAEPTFFGLRQVLNEPVERVYLGPQPPILSQVKANPTRYISSVAITKQPSTTLTETWFDGVDLSLNPGLIAVIGNKGSGKSALTDIIGLLGNSPHEQTFSFLHPEQFRHGENKAAAFEAELAWESGEIVRKNLADSVDRTSVETVKYIPQQHLEAICDELKGGREGRFEEQLKSVIFSRASRKDRLNFASLDELVAFKTAELQSSIRIARDSVREANKEVVEIESHSTQDYRDRLRSQLLELERELEAHRKTKPRQVAKPSADEETQEESEKLTRLIEDLAKTIQQLDNEMELQEKAVIEERKRIELVGKARRSLENLQNSFGRALEDLASVCRQLGIEASELAKLTVRLEPLNVAESKAQASLARAEEALDVDNSTSLAARRVASKGQLVKHRKELDRPNKEYQEYLEQAAIWERREQTLVGGDEIPGTTTFVKVQLAQLETLPRRLEEARDRQLAAALELYQQKARLVTIYEELYEPVQLFIDTHSLARERFGLQFKVPMVARQFASSFLGFINQNRRGSFRGDQEGRRLARQLVTEADFDTSEGVKRFLVRVLEHLRFDQRADNPEQVSISSQLVDRSGHELEDFYDFLLGLEYLDPRFEIRWDDKPLERLSPGERGTLLLIFFLLIDDSQMPLLIDQPEDNLDNQTVYELLVDCIREAKTNRQIIMVTHNPNLAVVCDAEQVIYASLDKGSQYRVEYISGALEDPGICGCIVDVLEGTRPAIEKRVSKYNVIFDS